MTEWEPATDAEIAMRNALRTDDQESYFRILAGVDLLLPVSADALAGLAPLGWGTWSTGGRTHVLAFTSPSALQACLADYTGSARRVAYAELADTWPNLEWWLAVNPGLPIEGYLPAWFVAQLSRGDLRLPTRGPGREGSNAPNRIQDLHAAATLAATAAAQGYQAGEQSYAAPGSGGPVPGSAGTAGGSAPGGSAAGAPGPGGPAYGGSAPDSGSPRYGGPGSDSPGSGSPGSGSPASDSPGSGAPASSGPDADAGGQVGPGGLPLRTPGAVLPSGLPSRVPASPSGSGGIPGGQFNGFGTAPGDRPAPIGDQSGGRPVGSPGDVPAAYRPPSVPAREPAGPGVAARAASGSSALSALGSRAAGAVSERNAPTGTAPGGSAQPPRPDAHLPTRTPMAQTPPLPAHIPPPAGKDDAPAGPTGAEQAGDDAPSRTGLAEAGAISAKSLATPGEDRTVGPGGLPRRQVTPPEARPASMAAAAQAFAGRSPASAQQPPTAQPPTVQASTVHVSTAQAPTAQAPTARPSTTQEPATREPAAARQSQPGLAPPVIPGAAGAARSTAGPAVPAPATRPAVPPSPQPDARPDAEPDAQPAAVPPRPDAQPGGVRPTERPSAEQTDTHHPAAGRRDTAAAGRTDAGAAGRSDSEPTGPGGPRPTVAGSTGSAAFPDDDFVAANEVERDLYRAAADGSTDSFLSTLLLASVLVPVADNSRAGSAPGESGFAFRTEEFDGEVFLVVFTSRDRLAEHFAEPVRTVGVRFIDLIRRWPDPAWSFAVNPTSPIGARYPGPQVIALASWAVEAGLGGDPAEAPAERPQRPAEPTAQLTIMQKAVPAEQIDYYLERGYDRVAGFVHRAGEVEHLRSPGDLFAALGLLYDGSPYQADAKEAFVLRWPAHRPSLYRIPYGGQSEQALRAMDGWVIERPPFRGNGFAPGEGKDVIAEFKVDSVRLPHGTQLWRMDVDGAEQMIAVFDGDAPVWRRVGEQ